MKKLTMVVFILVVALALTGRGIAAPGGDAEKGKATYASKCNMCHGPDGVAKEAMAKMFKVEMKALGSKEVQAKSDADIKKIIKEGNGKMKAVTLTDDEIANVIAYVRTLAKK